MTLAPIVSSLIDISWKAVLPILAAIVAIRLLHRSSAAQRHAVWTACFLVLAALPFLSFLPGQWVVHLETAAPKNAMAIPMDNSALTSPAIEEPSHAVTATASGVALDLELVFVFLWLAGTLALLARSGSAVLALRGVARRAEALQDPEIHGELASILGESSSRVGLLTSSETTVPITWGWRHPVILLPVSWQEWSRETLERALRHECAHIIRRDWPNRMLAEVTCALHWMNPLVWFGARRLRLAQEEACDDLVLGSGESATAYAEQLVESARRMQRPLNAAVAMAQPSTLRIRVAGILEENRNRAPMSKFGWRLCAGIAVFCLGLAATVRIGGAAEPQQEPAVTIRATIMTIPSSSLEAYGLKANAVLSTEKADELLTALKSQEGNEILTAPTVVTRSGSTAEMLIGEMLENEDADETDQQDFRGVNLQVTPVLKGTSITLKANLEIRSDASATKEDGVTVRNTELNGTVTLEQGESVMLISTEEQDRPVVVCVLKVDLTPEEGSPKAQPDTGKVEPAPTADMSNAIEGIYAELVRSKAERAEMATKYADKHPRMVEQDAVITTLEAELSLARSAGAPEAKKADGMAGKLDSIILPNVSFDATPLPQVIDFLHQASVQHDPAKQGVTIELRADYDVAPNITLSIANIPLGEAIRYVATLTGLEVRLKPASVELIPKGD